MHENYYLSELFTNQLLAVTVLGSRSIYIFIFIYYLVHLLGYNLLSAFSITDTKIGIKVKYKTK